MATNKNQHFVPRCYLRSFTNTGTEAAINLYNIDRKRFIKLAPLKHQCSKDYFYGRSEKLENAIQFIEISYSKTLREILAPGFVIADEHRIVLKSFWLLQYLRTEAASKRAVTVSEDIKELILSRYGTASDIENHPDFRLEIRDAVQMAMKVFHEQFDIVSDLKICLIKNQTKIPFITSDDPAILTNRWHLTSNMTRGHSFGLHSAGNLIILPINPKILCIGYDGDIYSVPHCQGWLKTRSEHDVLAFNQHQFLNCFANIYFQDASHSPLIHKLYLESERHRPKSRNRINLAALVGMGNGLLHYSTSNSEQLNNAEEALMHIQTIHPHPSIWPSVINWKNKGFAFTNNTAIGYVREMIASCRGLQSFNKIRIRT